MNPYILPQGFHFFERGWLSSNSLLIQSSDHAVIFDTGYITHARQLLQLIRNHLNSQPLDLIVNSHLHSDHCGGNALLQSTYQNIDIQIPNLQFDDVLNWDQTKLTYEVSGQTCSPFSQTLCLFDGGVLKTDAFQWEIHSAPGHDNDEFILFEPELKILFSADALWENGLGVIFPEFLGGIGFENVSKTLDLIAELKPDIVLPGHGSLFLDYETAIENTRKKLDYFVTSPDRHAFYSAKVLMKFHLLEVQRASIEDFDLWCATNKMLLNIHHSYFYNMSFENFKSTLINDLVLKHAIEIQSEYILNL